MQSALSGITGPADVSPQVFTLDPYNPGSNVNLPSLTFSTSTVRAAFIKYAVFRTTSTNTAYEGGEIKIVYNPNGPTGNKWETDRKYVGDGSITFNVTDVGQVQFSTTALAGIGHTGTITYTAQALLQS